MTTPLIPPEVKHTVPNELRGLSPLMPALHEMQFHQFVEQQTDELYRSLGIPARVVNAVPEMMRRFQHTRELSRFVK